MVWWSALAKLAQQAAKDQKVANQDLVSAAFGQPPQRQQNQQEGPTLSSSLIDMFEQNREKKKNKKEADEFFQTQQPMPQPMNISGYLNHYKGV